MNKQTYVEICEQLGKLTIIMSTSAVLLILLQENKDKEFVEKTMKLLEEINEELYDGINGIEDLISKSLFGNERNI